MSKLKTAIPHVFTAYFECPHCHQDILLPFNGICTCEAREYETGMEIKCQECGEWIIMPEFPADHNWEALYCDLYRQVFGENEPDKNIKADIKKRIQILKDNRII